jgi:CBS domain-containing protein
MELKAKDIMVKDFSTIRPDAPVREAVRMILEGKPRQTGYKPFGIMVTDEIGRLVGMISMFDILYHLRPPFMNYEMEGSILWKGELEPYLDQFRTLRVEQVMTTPVITCAPDDHLMQVIDRMVKKRARRLPVVDSDRILGIVYLSDVFYGLCGIWLECNIP